MQRFVPDATATVAQCSVFDAELQAFGEFDVVYSWGVLHHTGDMARALVLAAGRVKPEGLFIFALYRKTWMCPFWKIEKRWYARASKTGQALVRQIYVGLFRLGLLLTGHNFSDYVHHYRSNRGMDFQHDVHDWLGGYPYESISVHEAESFMREEGFVSVLIHAVRGRYFGRSTGILGSGCDEFVYRRLGPAKGD